MTARAVQIFQARKKREEGEKLKPYDDATAKPVVAPVGNLSWGRGYNLMVCGSPGLFDAMDDYLDGQLDAALSKYSWYTGLDSEPTRQSVLLDVAYNEGLGGLLHFPHMLAFAAAKDWPNMSRECKVADASLDASRYAPLRQLILTGEGTHI
jgi:hypothetical protein